MNSVRTRIGAVVLAVGLASGLAACQSNVGAAATVDGQRISEADVNKYVNATGTTSTTRAFIVSYLIKAKLYERALAKKGVAVNETQLRSSEVAAIQNVLGAQTASSQDADARLATGVQTLGVKSSFAPVVVRGAELEYAFILASKVADPTALAKAVRTLNIPVSASPRYGSWSTTEQELARPSNPDFLRTSPTPAASPGS